MHSADGFPGVHDPTWGHVARRLCSAWGAGLGRLIVVTADGYLAHAWDAVVAGTRMAQSAQTVARIVVTHERRTRPDHEGR